MSKRTLLVTGASGFIGSFIVSEGLRRGFEVWAAVRASSSRAYLQDSRIHFLELDLSNVTSLRAQLVATRSQLSDARWDYVVHAAGATKCRNKEEFYRTNTQGTENLVWALKAEGMTPERFIFISSLSVLGAIREQAVRAATPDHPWIYAPMQAADAPRPNTAYGQSKLKAEIFLQHVQDFPCVILRPTGVYGPRERDYFLMAKSIRQHIDFAVGYRPQELTFIYVRDLVQAVFLAMEAKEAVGKTYLLSDGGIYHSRRFSDLLCEEMGHPWVCHIKAPLWFLKGVCACVGTLSARLGKTTTLNLDKYRILRQRNWQCDIEPARRELGYEPAWPLERGVKETVLWYKQHKWL